MATSNSDIDLDGDVWGGDAWRRFVARAFEFIGPLHGKQVLELGFRDGRISCALARLGARVTGLEVTGRSVQQATALATRLGLNGRTEFRAYNGDLSTVPGQFDAVFTKSTLVLTDLASVIPAIRDKLRPGGRFAFIENAAGGPLVRLLRYCTRLPRTYSGVSYFTPAHIAMIRESLSVDIVDSTSVPPVYLICGQR